MPRRRSQEKKGPINFKIYRVNDNKDIAGAAEGGNEEVMFDVESLMFKV